MTVLLMHVTKGNVQCSMEQVPVDSKVHDHVITAGQAARRADACL